MLPKVDNYDEESVYKREYIKEEQRDFIDGMDRAVDEVYWCFNKYINELDNSIPMIKELQEQILRLAQEDISHQMKLFADEYVIEIIDEYCDEEEHFNKEHERFENMKKGNN